MNTKRETILIVEGMSCGSCVRHVDEALRAIEGVEAVEVDLKEGRVIVKHAGEANLSAWLEALADAGYSSREAEA